MNAGSDNHNILVMEKKLIYQCVVVSSEVLGRKERLCHPTESSVVLVLSYHAAITMATTKIYTMSLLMISTFSN